MCLYQLTSLETNDKTHDTQTSFDNCPIQKKKTYWTLLLFLYQKV